MKTKMFLMLTLLIIVFVSCNKNETKNEPAPDVVDPRITYGNGWMETKGFIVVKFKDEAYKEKVLARKFSKYDDNKYYIPMISSYFEQAEAEFVPKFNKEIPVYTHLIDDYYVVDYQTFLYSALFNDYHSHREFLDIARNHSGQTIADIKNEVQNDRTSAFVNDMKSLVVTKYDIKDYTLSSLYEEFGKQEYSFAQEDIIGYSPFEYLQYVFMSDILKSAGYSDMYELLERNEIMHLIPVFQGKCDNFNSQDELHCLFGAILSGSVILPEEQIWNSLRDQQNKYLTMLQTLLQEERVSLPPSLL